MSATLLGSIDWCKNAPNSPMKDNPSLTWKQKSYMDLESKLKREKFEPNEACRRGIAFEDQVCRFATMPVESLEGFSEEFKLMVNSVRGYKFQVYKQRTIDFTFDGVEYDLKFLGFLDAMRDDHIIDLKTTGKYKKDKYLQTLQHKIYCWMTGIKEFDYIIAQWSDYPKIKSVYNEKYICEDFIEVGVFLKAKMTEFMQFLKDLNMLDLYLTTYCNKE